MNRKVGMGSMILVFIVLAAVKGLSRQTERASLSGPYLARNRRE